MIRGVKHKARGPELAQQRPGGARAHTHTHTGNEAVYEISVSGSVSDSVSKAMRFALSALLSIATEAVACLVRSHNARTATNASS